ncbi:MAG: ABC transporter substrate-binding protein [Candidatus Omnitrophica bacterium]|nr:ABC transporter substrate-binding protein [Candidatus Omnitrophota bacterium]
MSTFRKVFISVSLFAFIAAGLLTVVEGFSQDTITIGIGHQSHCTDTYAAGIIMKEMGFLEKHLPHAGKYKDVKFNIVWEDYPFGPPITAEMVKGRLQIGVMGDYPMILNGYEASRQKDYASYMVAFTGYNPRGSGNGIVVPKDSGIYNIDDLRGKTISVPFGSAAHGMVLKAMKDRGWVEGKDMTLINQKPKEGEEAIKKGEISGHADFCPWTELIEFRGYGRKVFDGSDAGVPYLHGVVVEKRFADTHPEIVKAFLNAMLDAGEYMKKNPQELAEKLEKWTGIEKEVQYLYFGPGGILTHDPTFKPDWIRALRYDVIVLKTMGKIVEFNTDPWLNDSFLRDVFKERGLDYEAQLKRKDIIHVAGHDKECKADIREPKIAAQIWTKGEIIQSYSSPLCMMRAYKSKVKAGKKVNAIYTQDFETGLKLFGDRAYYLIIKAEPEPIVLSFATKKQAEDFASKGKARVVSFEEALAEIER